MGYSTTFEGQLNFKSDISTKALVKLKSFLGEDCRDHPEWGNTNLTYISLKLNKDFSGIQWDGSEKTYELVDKVNLIISNMQEEFPDFELEGKLLAQGEEINDRWILNMENGKAIKKKLFITGKKIECPHCGENFIVEEEK